MNWSFQSTCGICRFSLVYLLIQRWEISKSCYDAPSRWEGQPWEWEASASWFPGSKLCGQPLDISCTPVRCLCTTARAFKGFFFFPLILVWKYRTIPHGYFFIDIPDLSSLWNSPGCEMLQLGSTSMWVINTKPSLFLILFLPTFSHHSGPNLWIFILRTRVAVRSRCVAWEPRFPSRANPLQPWSEQTPSG